MSLNSSLPQRLTGSEPQLHIPRKRNGHKLSPAVTQSAVSHACTSGSVYDTALSEGSQLGTESSLGKRVVCTQSTWFRCWYIVHLGHGLELVNERKSCPASFFLVCFSSPSQQQGGKAGRKEKDKETDRHEQRWREQSDRISRRSDACNGKDEREELFSALSQHALNSDFKK